VCICMFERVCESERVCARVRVCVCVVHVRVCPVSQSGARWPHWCAHW